MTNRILKQIDEKHFVLNVDGLDTYFIRWTLLSADDFDYGYRVSLLRDGSFVDVRGPIDEVAQMLRADRFLMNPNCRYAQEVARD